MSKKKKTTPTDVLRARSQSRPFLDGFDSYCAEYDFWKSLGLVRGLLGVFELSNQDMVEKDTDQLLAELGFGEHEHLTHLIQVDNSERSTDRATGGGWTFATRDPFGKIRPIIFVQKEVGDPKLDGEEEAVYKLLILLHELGHAKDIVEQTNYNHKDLTLDIVEAEIYAHRFVLQHTRRMGYRYALCKYLSVIDDHLLSRNSAAKAAAERLTREIDLEDYRQSAKDRSHAEINQALEASGRMKEFQKWSVKKSPEH